MKVILSMNDLASRIGIPRIELETVADKIDRHYRSLEKRYQKTGKVRTLHAPSPRLKEIQRRITRQILIPIEISPHVHGGVKGCSPRSNVKPHLRRKWVANLDVRDFFPQVRHRVVLVFFRKELGFGRDVARLLTRLVTRDGGLPQGAATSLAMANLLLWKPLDVPVAQSAANLSLHYTRWVDDICVSGDDPRPIINEIAKRLSRRGLRMYREKARFHTKPKLKITPGWQRQEVTGLVVNGASPSISKPRRDRVRAAIHEASWFSNARLEKALASINGRINYIAQYNPKAATRLRSKLERMRAQTLSPTSRIPTN